MTTCKDASYGAKLDRILHIRNTSSFGDLVLPTFPIAPLPIAEMDTAVLGSHSVSAYVALLMQAYPRLTHAVQACCGPAPWIVRSAGIEDLTDHVNAGAYASLICRTPDELMERVAAVALSGTTERAWRQQALSGRSAQRDEAIACFVQPLLNIDVASDVGVTHSPYLTPAFLDRIETVCAALMETFDFAAIDCEWGLETTLGFVSMTTIMPRDLRVMNLAHTIGFGFASAQSTGSQATTLALRPASTDLRLWRASHLCEVDVQRMYLLQARPASPDAAFRERVVLTDDCYKAITGRYDAVEAGLLLLGTACCGRALIAPNLMSAWRQYLALDAREQAAIAIVLVDQGSAEEHAGIMFRQQKLTCVRVDTSRIPLGVDYAAFDRGTCVLGDLAMLRSIETELRNELVLPDECALVFTGEQLTSTGELTRDCSTALSQLRGLPVSAEAKQRLVARSEQPMATRWMQRVDGTVESPSLLACIGRSRHSRHAVGLEPCTEFAKAYEFAAQVSLDELQLNLPALSAVSPHVPELIASADLRVVMALVDCEAAASWVPPETLSRVLHAAAMQLAGLGREHAVLVLQSVSIISTECAQLPIYDQDETISYLDVLARSLESGLSPESMAFIHLLALPIPSAAALARRALTHHQILEPIHALVQAAALFKSAASAGEEVAPFSARLNDVYSTLRSVLREADLAGIAEQLRGSLIETYDATLKALLARVVETADADSYRRYLGVMQNWIALLGESSMSHRDDVVLRRFQAWLLQWSAEEIPGAFEIQDRNWRSEFDAIVAAGETAARYENPHVLHNLLHQWSLAGLYLDTRLLPRRVQALERFCSTFSSRSTKVLRFERELLEIQIPMGTHKASYVFTPRHITVEWTEPPDCPGDEIARILAFEVFLDRFRTWMFPGLTVRRERILGTWTLIIRLSAPPSGAWHPADFTRFVAATRFLFDASYDFSYVKNDAVDGFSERFNGSDWQRVVATWVNYRTVLDDTPQYIALHTSPMSSAVSAVARSGVVRGLMLRCLRGGADYCWAMIDRYAHWLEAGAEEHDRWRDRYEYLRQASLILAARWPRDAFTKLARRDTFHVGHDMIAACLFRRSDLRDELCHEIAAGDAASDGLLALIARQAPEIAVAARGAAPLAAQLADTGVRFRRAKHFLAARFGDRIDTPVLERLLDGMDTVPLGCTTAAENAIQRLISSRGGTVCRFELERGVDWTALDTCSSRASAERSL